jgi:hypothetical protein
MASWTYQGTDLSSGVFDLTSNGTFVGGLRLMQDGGDLETSTAWWVASGQAVGVNVTYDPDSGVLTFAIGSTNYSFQCSQASNPTKFVSNDGKNCILQYNAFNNDWTSNGNNGGVALPVGGYPVKIDGSGQVHATINLETFAWQPLGSTPQPLQDHVTYTKNNKTEILPVSWAPVNGQLTLSWTTEEGHVYTGTLQPGASSTSATFSGTYTTRKRTPGTWQAQQTNPMPVAMEARKKAVC